MFEKKKIPPESKQGWNTLSVWRREREHRCPRTLRSAKGLERVIRILFLSGQGFDIRNKHLRKCIFVNTLRCIYLSAMPVVGFRVECPFYKLYKVFPFPSSGATASRKSNEENRNSTQVRPRSKLNAKLKTHVLGVNQRGYGWIGLALWLHFLEEF